MVSLRGPLFFGAARRLGDVLDAMTTRPRVFILRVRNVPIVDSTGVAALSDFVRRCRALGIRVIISGLRQQPKEVLSQTNFAAAHDNLSFSPDFAESRKLAASLIAPSN